MPDQKTMGTRCLGEFSVMWVTKLLISPIKIRIFCPKLTFLFILGQALPAHLVPCWWVGWWLWRAGCISQDTYLLYLLTSLSLFSLHSKWNTFADIPNHKLKQTQEKVDHH